MFKAMKLFICGGLMVVMLQGMAIGATFLTRDVSINNEAGSFSLTVLTPVDMEMKLAKLER